MELKVVIPSLPPSPPPAAAAAAAVSDFNFGSSCSTPFTSAPSSPPYQYHNHQRNNLFLFYSAPTSPRSSEADHLPLLLDNAATSSVPFNWEDKPGVPKSSCEDFEFDFSGQLQLENPSLSAEELFDGGKIKPLKPPPRLQVSTTATTHFISDSPKSPRSPISKFKEAFSPRQKEDVDPFEAALERTRKSDCESNSNTSHGRVVRGRDKISSSRQGNSNNSTSSHKRGVTRSLSPLRVSEFAAQQQQQQELMNSNSAGSSSNSRPYRKWSLKDFLLFRSASEGRATSKDTLKKYFSPSPSPSSANGSVSKNFSNSSLRSGDGSNGSTSSRRRSNFQQASSAHELHYTVNRAVAEDLKKKTSLPYKHGLLGCLGMGFTSSGVEQFSRGIGTLYRS